MIPEPQSTSGELDFARTHDYVSAACAHRKHSHCDMVCKYCEVTCGCVCHRWPVEMTGL